jgi:hypothetical protein
MDPSQHYEITTHQQDFDSTRSLATSEPSTQAHPITVAQSGTGVIRDDEQQVEDDEGEDHEGEDDASSEISEGENLRVSSINVRVTIRTTHVSMLGGSRIGSGR